MVASMLHFSSSDNVDHNVQDEEENGKPKDHIPHNVQELAIDKFRILPSK